ncbi:CBO0543 family protein [Anaerobacillus sp. MEB173]|uniref:CBO0543 family protein n=1 Tax=Anaerobacillus sp. MEB173 TaxID=3383345 RepID=UPI003F936161
MSTLTQLKILLLNPSWDEIIKLRQKTRDMLFEYWITETVFSFNWWLLLTSTFIFFIIWFIVLDKKRILEVASYGLLIGSIALFLDIIGITLVLWSYPDRLLPIITPIIEIHKVHMPIAFMIIYQYCNTWKSFFISLTITSFIFSFVLEPLIVWLGIYEIYHWKYLYSFPIYILIGLILRWVIIKVKEIEKKHM